MVRRAKGQCLGGRIGEAAADGRRAVAAAARWVVQPLVAGELVHGRQLRLPIVTVGHGIVCGGKRRRVDGRLDMAAVEVAAAAVDRKAKESEERAEDERHENDRLAALSASHAQYSVLYAAAALITMWFAVTCWISGVNGTKFERIGILKRGGAWA